MSFNKKVKVATPKTCTEPVENNFSPQMRTILANTARFRDPDNTQGTSTSTSRFGLRNQVVTQTTIYRKGRTEVEIIDTPYRTRVNQGDKNCSPEMNTVASSSTSHCFFLSFDLKRQSAEF